jgi:hypothetical protein
VVSAVSDLFRKLYPMLAPVRAMRVLARADLARLPGFDYDGGLQVIQKKDQA